MEYAKKALELGGSNEPACLDTLAAAYAENHQYKEAIKWEIKSLDGLTGTNRIEGEKALMLYKKGKPYREPGPK